MKGIKTGGREAGTPNKLTKELREVLNNLLQKEIQTLPENLEKLETKDRLEILVKLLPYIIPKMTQMEFTSPEDKIIEVTFDFGDKNPAQKFTKKDEAGETNVSKVD